MTEPPPITGDDRPTGGRSARASLKQLVKVVGALIGIAFLVIALRDSLRHNHGRVLPSWEHILIALALSLAGLTIAGRSWQVLFESRLSHRAIRRGFYASQLGKYVPGGVWQVVGQIGLTADAGVPLRNASTAFPVFVVTQVVAGGVVLAFISVVDIHGSLALRLLSLLGLLSTLLLHRQWMVASARLAARMTKRTFEDGLVPPQAAIIRACALSVATLVLAGSSFAVLLSAHGLGTGAPTVVAAWAGAWTVGFLALPFPSGLGVREGILVAMIGGPIGAAPIIAASVAHRVVTIVAELIAIVGTQLQRRRDAAA